MTQLTVRNVTKEIVGALKRQAAAHGRSAEAEHRDILRKALLEQEKENFAERARSLRERLSSKIDSSEIIRSDRDRDHTE
jgi:antitoxin FitA